MPKPKTICLTGIHHTPAIELIHQLGQTGQSWQIHYLTHHYQADTHLKNTLLPKLKSNLHLIQCNKFDRQHLFLSTFKSPLLIFGVLQSLLLLLKIKPNIIVSFGGYPSVPVIIAGWLLKIPSITHEQTPTISLATRINSYFCQKIALSFPNPTFSSNKVVVTGNLVRQHIFNLHSPNYAHLKTKITHHPLIYITGGSQGSQFINTLTEAILPKLNQYTIIHQTGQKPISQKATSNYLPTEYIGSPDIGWVLNHASLIISRAGANTCQEIQALNQRAIIIPHPKTQQDEQIKNAHWLASQLHHQIIVLPQDSATPKQLLSAIKTLMALKSNISSHQPSTVHPLVKLINHLT
jgi:UDP-N-acetylglucosamine--N-acetylmuramyl-(pentapeptide) pyrophosphoryl-undecaprenol N-acetylglucosamine transferase